MKISENICPPIKRENKLNRKSPRIPGFDYNSPGYYFITIATKNREHFFGEIENHEDMYPIRATKTGLVAMENLMAIPDHFSHVNLDYVVVMPDHVHLILELKFTTPVCPVGTQFVGTPVGTQFVGTPVGTQHAASLRGDGKPEPGSIPAIIRSYKSSVTRQTKLNGDFLFAWQSRYHDRIIRDENELYRIREYIRMNPERWEEKHAA